MNYFVLSSFVFVKIHPRRTDSLPHIVTSLRLYFPFPKSFSCNTYASPRKRASRWDASPERPSGVEGPLVPPKPFKCNTYRPPRKCCKQKTYNLDKPFRCNTYKNPGEGVFFPFWKALLSHGDENYHFHSSSFFSHSCALFCIAKNSTLLFSSDSALFTSKHPGGGVPCSRTAHCRSRKERSTCLNLLPAKRLYFRTSFLRCFRLSHWWTDGRRQAIISSQHDWQGQRTL